MQITVHTEELNAEQLGYLEAIIRVKKEKYLAYEKGNAVCAEPKSEEKVVNEPTPPYQPELPVEEAPTEEAVSEKPKRTRRTKAEIEAENAQEPQDVSEPTQEVEKAVEVPQNDSDSTSRLTLSDIKTKAQDLVQKVSRDAVKNAINKYADKISEVKESDYSALMADFEALEK